MVSFWGKFVALARVAALVESYAAD